MNTGEKTTFSGRVVRARLSTLWVVVMFNMVFADILTFIKPGALQELWAGQAGVQVTVAFCWPSRSCSRSRSR